MTAGSFVGALADFPFTCTSSTENGFWKQVAFRNPLLRDAKLRDAYDDLKQRLAKLHSTDREAYTRARTAFIAGSISTATS